MRYNECDRLYEDQVIGFIKHALRQMSAYREQLDMPLIEVTEIPA